MHIHQMSEYKKIIGALTPTFERFGLDRVDEELHPDVFGSAYSIFSNKILSYRVIWDGKDGAGYVQYGDKEKGWDNLNSSAPEAAQDGFENSMLRIRVELAEHIALRKLNA